MRQLNLAKKLTNSAWEADQVQALPLLFALSKANPLACTEAEEAAHFRYLTAVATQYRGQGAS